MSHFTVLVVGENPEGQLEPFWELDLSAEEAASDPRAEFHETSEDVQAQWDALSEKERVEYADINDYASQYHGYSCADGKFGFYSNPNAKWDWYQLGGRWTGYFKVKKMPLITPKDVSFNSLGLSLAEMENLAKLYCTDASKFIDVTSKFGGKTEEVREEVRRYCIDVYPEHSVGNPGLMTEPPETGWADQLRKRDIDIEGMKDDARDKAAARYAEYEKAVEGIAPMDCGWDTFRERFPSIELAREAYGNHPWIQAVRKIGYISNPYEYFRVNTGGKEKFIESAGEQVLSTFAVLMNGEWHERGEMGWFGMVHDEKSEYDWCAKFMELFESLPDDTLLSMYDCHI